MLVLTRKPEQTLCIGDDITVTILEVRGDQVRLGIRAPRGVKVHREEVVARILLEGERGGAAGTEDTDGTLEGERGAWSRTGDTHGAE